jgi:hypothetical protein
LGRLKNLRVSNQLIIILHLLDKPYAEIVYLPLAKNKQYL